MKIITISRQFGSGGRELGKRMADILGWDYYDSEIISTVASNSGLDSKYVEDVLDNQGWQCIPLTYRSTIGSPVYLQTGKVSLLLEQKRVIEQIAALGKDCIIVGRNADVLLAAHKPFSVFVCAEMGARVRRCRERAPEDEKLTERQLVRKIRQIDKLRAQTRAFLSDSSWGDRESFHLTVNTTDREIKALAPAVAAFAQAWFESESKESAGE